MRYKTLLIFYVYQYKGGSMILTGLVSIAFNQLPPEQVIALVMEAGLVGVE
jgi:hypothetical protein